MHSQPDVLTHRMHLLRRRVPCLQLDISTVHRASSTGLVLPEQLVVRPLREIRRRAIDAAEGEGRERRVAGVAHDVVAVEREARRQVARVDNDLVVRAGRVGHRCVGGLEAERVRDHLAAAGGLEPEVGVVEEGEDGGDGLVSRGYCGGGAGAGVLSRDWIVSVLGIVQGYCVKAVAYCIAGLGRGWRYQR